MANKTVRIIVHGKVQGVCYRMWTCQTASNYNIFGWVRNVSDGTVEAILSGDAKNVDQMIQTCYQGPSAAKVSKIDVTEAPDQIFDGFRQMPTA